MREKLQKERTVSYANEIETELEEDSLNILFYTKVLYNF